jgi:ketosteroid isomerase-like protein
MTSDEREIRKVHSIWIDAVNAGDLARLLTLVAEDVVFLTPPIAARPGGIFVQLHGRPPTDADLLPASWKRSLLSRGRLHAESDALSVTRRAGEKAAQLAGHRMTVYRKQRDGRWLLSRDVHTLSAVKK